MRPARRRPGRGFAGADGFTLVETLAAVALTAAVVAALGTITAQWLPNWKRGFARVQRTEQLRLGLERIAADLSAAEFVTPNADTKRPLFIGSELSVTFVRTAIGPNATPGLQVVRLGEASDERGLALVRESAPFTPLPAASGSVQLPRFSGLVALVRAPYRIGFSYAGPDRTWRGAWLDATRLPRAVRVTVRAAATGQVLAVSTTALVHVDLGVGCVGSASVKDCIAKRDAPPPKATGAQEL